MEVLVKNLEELEAEAVRFVDSIAQNPRGATLITLSGELGTGKTALTKAIARALGVTEIVNSPTFVLEKIYKLPGDKKFKRLIHIDAYRLEEGSELAPLGFDEIMKDVGNLILIEWPEKVADALPTPAMRISLVANSDDSRTISYG